MQPASPCLDQLVNESPAHRGHSPACTLPSPWAARACLHTHHRWGRFVWSKAQREKPSGAAAGRIRPERPRALPSNTGTRPWECIPRLQDAFLEVLGPSSAALAWQCQHSRSPCPGTSPLDQAEALRTSRASRGFGLPKVHLSRIPARSSSWRGWLPLAGSLTVSTGSGAGAEVSRGLQRRH